MSTESNRKPARRRSGDSHITEWTPPPLEGKQYRIMGSSQLDQFVADHNLADIVRELVQNEFDAEGSKLEIYFGDDASAVKGNGNPIDSKGRKRLISLFGTDYAIGGDHGECFIPPKENSIGSKNFGLRSLFVIGDKIYVRSNGKMIVLDFREVFTSEESDPASGGQRGIRIHVPFRSESLRNRHKPFTVEKEHQEFDFLTDDFFAKLMKLAPSGSGKGIEKLAIRSERTSQNLSWRQTTRSENCRSSGVSCVRRTGRLMRTSTETNPKKSGAFEELEFFRVVAIPKEHEGEKYPPYYRARGGLRIGVSLPIKRSRTGKPDRIDLSQSGTFFHPLAAKHTGTGAVVSVNAPFQMDGDRSDLNNCEWNRWLSRQAARLAIDLLVGDWLGRFGADAFLALSPKDGKPDWFSKAVSESFRTEACWPTRARESGSPLHVKAEAIIIPTHEALDGHLREVRYLDDRLSSYSKIKDLARDCGAKPFSLNSLIRLRCAPKDKSKLRTKVPEGEADRHFGEYDKALSGINFQVGTAKALTALAKHLSNDNRYDLKMSRSMLAADGSLNAAANLKFVEKSAWDACPEECSNRLHPQLLEYKTIAKLCEPFDVNKWIIETAKLAGEKPPDEEEKEKLDDERWEKFYSYLLDNGAKINRSALSAVKRNRTVKDHRGDRAAPHWLVDLPEKQFQALKSALKAPDRKLRRSREFFKSLRIRKKLKGEDLIKTAEYVAARHEGAEGFEDVLAKQASLLNQRKTMEGLREIAFLRTRSGSLGEPSNLHLPTSVNEACLNRPEIFVGGTNKNLYRRLGCLEEPSFDALLDVLRELQNEERGPEKPEKFYPAFVDALRRQGMPFSEFEDEPILWVNGGFHEPEVTLVGSNGVPPYFHRYLPHFTGSAAVCSAFVALGASRSPQSHHWRALFEELTERCPTNSETLPDSECRILKDAYYRLGGNGLPEGISENMRCLLSKAGTLHTLRELQRGTYLEDDFPKLSEAFRENGTNIAFAVTDSDTLPFFENLGLKKLSDVSQGSNYEIGDECSSPAWLSKREGEMLKKFAQGEFFPIALDALAWKYARRNDSFKYIDQIELDNRLSSIKRIRIVSEIEEVYKVSGEIAFVSAEAAVVKDEFVFLRPKSLEYFHHMLAAGLAKLAGASLLSDVQDLSNLFYPLVQCRYNSDMRDHLDRQGAEPRKRTGKRDESFDEDEDPLMVIVEEAGSRIGHEDIEPDVGAGTESDVREDDSGDASPSEPPAEEPPRPMAPRGRVRAKVLTGSGNLVRSGGVSSGGGRGRSSWRSPAQRQRDEQIGRRGEEIALEEEQKRVSFMGKSPDECVVWESDKNPSADHDIRSVGENGETLWIEVKATSGEDGRFEWSRSEFELAVLKRENYEIHRVYQADTTHPTVVRIKDPISLLRTSGISLKLRSVSADVGSLKTAEEKD